MAAKQDIIGGFESHKYRSDEGWIVGYLDDGTCITGTCEEGSLVPGMIYQFFGNWIEKEGYGKQFAFEVFVVKEPNSRTGVVAYLEQYAPGIGVVWAGKLYDAFGGDAVMRLRTDPVLAAKATGGNVEKFKVAAAELQRLSKFEDTKVKLTTLFHGRGFGAKAIEACVKRWGIFAPQRIMHDPFCLLVEKIPGAGFERCNALYDALGKPKNRLKRLMIFMWHAIRSDRTGNTWIPMDFAFSRLTSTIPEEISIKKRKKILELGTRSSWLSVHRDQDGKFWIAEKEKAASEAYVAKRITELVRWTPPDDDTPEKLKETRAEQSRIYSERLHRQAAWTTDDPFSDL